MVCRSRRHRLCPCPPPGGKPFKGKLPVPPWLPPLMLAPPMQLPQPAPPPLQPRPAGDQEVAGEGPCGCALRHQQIRIHLQGMGYVSEATCILIGRIVGQGIIPIIMGTPTPGPAPSWLGCSRSAAAVLGVAAPASTGLGCPDAASLSCLVAVQGMVSVKGVSKTSPHPPWPLHPT